MTSWSELGSLLTIDDPVAARHAPAHIWECPNLVRFGDRWALIVSLWKHIDGATLLSGVSYLVGELAIDGGGPRFAPATGGSLDRGESFYAPQVLRHDGRVLLWGWAKELGRPEDEIDGAGWAGALTFCRELSLTDDVLASRPAAELTGLRRDALELVSGTPFAARAFELEPAGDATLWLVDGADERLVASIDASERARILVDGSIVEIFDGDATPLTTRAYPTDSSRWMLRLGRPTPLTAWTLDL
jgi:beta-fructofuranosidase